jgi:hypothetical protein
MSRSTDENAAAASQMNVLNLEPHHFGCLVRNLDQAIEAYRPLFPAMSPKIYVSAQKVTVCFVRLGEAISLELIEPAEPDAATQTMLKRGIAYYHVGYLVKDFEGSVEKLEKLGYKVVESFHSEAFEGKRCAFLMSPVLHLIELMES